MFCNTRTSIALVCISGICGASIRMKSKKIALVVIRPDGSLLPESVYMYTVDTETAKNWGNMCPKSDEYDTKDIKHGRCHAR